MQWLLLKGLVKSGQWTLAKNLCHTGSDVQNGLLFKTWEEPHVSHDSDSGHNALLTQEEQTRVSHQRANGTGQGRGLGGTCHSIRIP